MKDVADISEIVRNIKNMLDNIEEEPIAILEHGKPVAYLVSSADYEEMIDTIEDIHFADLIMKREPEKDHTIDVKLDEL